MQALREAGLDIRDAFPEPLTEDVVRAADHAMTMGCGDTCPIHPGKRYLDRDVADPEAATLDGARVILADIQERVSGLWQDIRDSPRDRQR